MSSTHTPNVIEVGAKDLHGHGVIACTNPAKSAWNGHPKVYVDVAHTGEGTCPYCGTVYRLKAGEKLSGQH